MRLKDNSGRTDELKNLIEVNGSDRLNLIFNQLIENVEQTWLYFYRLFYLLF